MLLQLLEPGQSDQEILTTNEPIIGIDLGTTHSLVAFSQNQKVETLCEDMGDVFLPSAVHRVEAVSPIVGYGALARQKEAPSEVLSSFKKFMGDPHHPHESQQALLASTHILRTLKERAQLVLGRPIKKAIVTVPAYFSESARAATRQAGHFAGLEIVRLISEPTAAALAYGLDKRVEGLYLVYDLGGGTFDVSLLRLEKEVFQVVATAGDTNLGGDTLDAAILAHLLKERVQQVGAESLEEAQTNSLLYQVRQLREALSQDASIQGTLTLEGRTSTHTLSRLTFENVAMPFVDRTLALVDQVLRDADLEPAALEGVVLVGGTTRTPLVRRKLEAFLGSPALHDIDPDHVVAWGAALQGEGLSGVQGSPLLMDVLALSLGLETMGNAVEIIIPRNSPLPISRTQRFTTFQDGQTAILIHVLQGESPHVSGCRSLTKFELSGFAPRTAGEVRLEVTFTMDADGLLTIHAKDTDQGVMKRVELKPTHGLSLDDMAALLSAAQEAASVSHDERALSEQSL
ncbi:MAG: Hsp70 family protein [Alphaproteobacteria bacterium]|jgi:molecular chaperone HscA|nr:Hsp70 family protein [Alphaproteobacteria bacterium]